MEAVLLLLFLALLASVGLVLGIHAARAANHPRPALPLNCGDCAFMVAKAKLYHYDQIEDPDGVIHYLCQKRWIEVTPVSPWCDLGRSKSRVVVGGKVLPIRKREPRLTHRDEPT